MFSRFSFTRTLISAVVCLCLVVCQVQAPGSRGASASRPAGPAAAAAEAVSCRSAPETVCLAAPLSAEKNLRSEFLRMLDAVKRAFPATVRPDASVVFRAAAVAAVLLLFVFVSPVYAAPLAGGAASNANLFLIIAACAVGFFIFILVQPANMRPKSMKVPFILMVLVIIAGAVFSFVPGLSPVSITHEPAPFETPLAQAQIDALAAQYTAPVMATLDSAESEAAIYTRLLGNPANMRALSDAAYYRNIPRAMQAALMTVEINTVGNDLRQTGEQAGRDLRSKNTTSTGIAELQVVHAVRLLPVLYADMMNDPAAPDYIRKALLDAQNYYAPELGGRNIFDAAVIGETSDSGAFLHENIIADGIMQNDAISIYLCAMYVREAMDNLHASDPARFPDPDTYGSTSPRLPPVYAGALQVYYIEGPAFALNPENAAVWAAVVGADVKVPNWNIYRLTVFPTSDRSQTMTVIDYLSASGDYSQGLIAELYASMLSDPKQEFSLESLGRALTTWGEAHTSPYEEGFFGLVGTNKDLRNAQVRAAMGAADYWLYSASPLYGLNDPAAYPATWSGEPQRPDAPAPEQQRTPDESGAQAPLPAYAETTPDGCAVDGFGQYYYTVRDSDTLSLIVYDMMPAFFPDMTYEDAMARVLELNPQITDVNLIRVGDRIYLTGPAAATSFMPTMVPGLTLTLLPLSALSARKHSPASAALPFWPAAAAAGQADLLVSA